MSHADTLFRENCRQILDHGAWDTGYEVRPRWADGASAHTVKRFGIVNRYDLSQEFPLLTLRKINFAAAVDEILWIWQKKSNNIRDLNSHIWDSWADAEGSIGKAYGYQLGLRHSFPEGEMDQVDMLLYQLKHHPLSRRMVSNLFVHSDLKEMHLYPCAYSLTLNVENGRLNGLLNQRSQDMLTANNWNVCQYAALLHMFAAAAKLAVGELVHVIADAHIYDRHVPLVEELISRQGFPAPRLVFQPGHDDFYRYRPEDFQLTDYRYHPFPHKIPVAV